MQDSKCETETVQVMYHNNRWYVMMLDSSRTATKKPESFSLYDTAVRRAKQIVASYKGKIPHFELFDKEGNWKKTVAHIVMKPPTA